MRAARNPTASAPASSGRRGDRQRGPLLPSCGLLVPEAVPSSLDKDVLEGGLAERDRFDVLGKRIDKVADELVTAVPADAERSADLLRRHAKAVANSRAQHVGLVALDGDVIAAKRRAQRVRRVERDQPPLIENAQPVTTFGLLHQ